MSLTSYFVFFLGLALEVVLVCRLAATGLWRRYPVLFTYVQYVIVQTIAGLLVLEFATAGIYAKWYWAAATVNLGLRFFVIWEIFRHTFPEGLPIRRLMSSAFLISTLSVMTLWGTETYGKIHSLPLAMERSFGFAQAVLTLAILMLARYYQFPIGRNVWGLALAFGMQSSLATVNAALIDWLHAFLPYWRLLDPLAFVAMIAMWTWAMWVYAPNPISTIDDPSDQTDNLRRWSEDWGQTVSVVRKAINP